MSNDRRIRAPAAAPADPAVEHLRRADARLRCVLESSPDAIWWLDTDGQTLSINRETCGYTVEEWRAGGLALLRSLQTDESRRRLDQALEYVRTSLERALGLRLEFVHRNGEAVQSIVANIAPIVDDAGQLIGISGVMHDVGDLEAAHALARENERRFRETVETAHDLIWSTDAIGRWTYLNQAAHQIYGQSPDDMLGRLFSESMHPDHVERDTQVLREVLGGKEIVQHETVHISSDGSERNLSFNLKPRLDKDWNIIGATGTARDITAQKYYQYQLEHLAEHDALTGLFNRHYFQRELDRAVTRARAGHGRYGLLYLDLDNFKYVNDTLGHAAGDQLLVELGHRLQERLRAGDVLARFGGDEFTLLVQDMNPEKIRQVAHSFHHLFKGYTFFQAEKVFDVRISIGATLIDQHAPSASDVLAQADLACGLAKARGRNQAHIYDPADTAKADMASDVSWSRKINEALEFDRFELYFQPIVRIADNAIDHYEVLLRMQDEDGELIGPGAFLPAAERFGLVHAIDRWVVEHAIEFLARRHAAGARDCFSINLSGRAFEDVELLRTIRNTLERTHLDPSTLTFEITETAAISHITSAKAFIEYLKAMNCRFALDDFGSGFSSYGYLKFLPADYLKIDGGFVQHLANDPVDQAIVRSMNQVAHALGKQTIAEFVEDERTLKLLRSYGVDYAQGYFLGRPSPDLGVSGAGDQ